MQHDGLKTVMFKSFLKVQKAINDKLIVAKLQSFSFIADDFKSFLTVYQTDAPMIAFLCSDLRRLLHELLSLIVKADAIEKSKTICDIDLDNKKKILPLKTVNIGFEVEGTISKFTASDMLNLSEVKTFRRECIKFLVFTLKKLFEKSPISCASVKNASCLKAELISKIDHN